MIVQAYCQFVQLSEYNGKPIMVFQDTDKGMFNQFTVVYEKGSFASPLDTTQPHWYRFRADEYKYRASLREFLGEAVG